MGNPFVFAELNSADISMSKAFYGKLFDWNLSESPEMNYTMIQVGEGTGGGMTKTMVDGRSPWVPYVTVAKVDAALQKARSMGAKIVMEPMNLDAFKIRICILMDPTDAPCGLLERL